MSVQRSANSDISNVFLTDTDSGEIIRRLESVPMKYLRAVEELHRVETKLRNYELDRHERYDAQA